MNRQASLKKIILNDYMAFTSLMVPVGVGIIYVLQFIIEGRSPVNFTQNIILGSLVLVAILCLAWRINLINGIFNDGIETQAVINHVSFYRDRGRVSCTYTFRNEQYISTSAVMKTKVTRQYQVGQSLTVLVDQNKPKRTVIRDLFIMENGIWK
jgi:hypothetical protein